MRRETLLIRHKWIEKKLQEKLWDERSKTEMILDECEKDRKQKMKRARERKEKRQKAKKKKIVMVVSFNAAAHCRRLDVYWIQLALLAKAKLLQKASSKAEFSNARVYMSTNEQNEKNGRKSSTEHARNGGKESTKKKKWNDTVSKSPAKFKTQTKHE